MKKGCKSIDPSELKHFRRLSIFRDVLGEVCSDRALDGSWADARRKLELADYLGLFLFGLLNPAIDSMRGVCAASELECMEKVCSRSVSLGSFSEAQHLVDVSVLEKVFEKLRARAAGAAPRGKRLEQLLELKPMVVDSSVWRVSNRLDWALWRKVSGGSSTTPDSAVRTHLVFDLCSGVPETVQMTPATTCERKVWKKLSQPGGFYVGDRYYGYSYKLLEEMVEKMAGFLIRMRITAEWIVEEELELTDEDRLAGVVWSGWVRLGCKGDGPRVRIVQAVGEEEAIILATTLTEAELPAGEIRELYRLRWEIEYYFRWLKCILRNRAWLCESPNGINIQVYLALIASVLLMLLTGKRPNKRCMELIQFFMHGMVGEAELKNLLAKYTS